MDNADTGAGLIFHEGSGQKKKRINSKVKREAVASVVQTEEEQEEEQQTAQKPAGLFFLSEGIPPSPFSVMTQRENRQLPFEDVTE